jgi:hypothetical protein
VNNSTTTICERCQASYVIEPDAPTVCPECGHVTDNQAPAPPVATPFSWFKFVVVGTFTILGGLIVFGLILAASVLNKDGRLIATAMDAVGAAIGALVLVAVLLGALWIVMKCVMLPFEMLRHLERQTRLLEEIRDRLHPS